ncbi:HAMP domain-containing histidine kinase [bacterium]|nr:HAMP domain-containing histidine kinase [bacterium]
MTTLLVIITLLSIVSLQGASKYRNLTKSINQRSTEIPLAIELGIAVSDLRSQLWDAQRKQQEIQEYWLDIKPQPGERDPLWQINLEAKIQRTEEAFKNYQNKLNNGREFDQGITTTQEEKNNLEKFKEKLDVVKDNVNSHNDVFESSDNFDVIETNLTELQDLYIQFPGSMQQRMESFSEDARTEYRAWMTISGLAGLAAFGMTAFLISRFQCRIIKPLEKLVEGARHVTAGNYDFRIKLKSNDEITELADAMNATTESFQSIKSDLNQQVSQRTREVVRSEKMASVGFLAAGVAHEINNPLASIAWSAESLETRIQDILNPSEDARQSDIDSEIEDMKKYLRRIQDEAFRCKGITAGLLDFSRMGDAQKSDVNLSQIIHSVVNIVKPLSKYRNREIVVDADVSIFALGNEQEIKQVALNLITNALGCVEENGRVQIRLKQEDNFAELIVTDNGCGMTPEVQKHLFEPFFTRRRNGQGTGLGLSITYQIIEEHGGKIIAHSDGPGFGSEFRVCLPLAKSESAKHKTTAA